MKASEILRHAEEAAAEQLRGAGKPVMDDASGVPDAKSLEAVVGGNWRRNESSDKKQTLNVSYHRHMVPFGTNS